MVQLSRDSKEVKKSYSQKLEDVNAGVLVMIHHRESLKKKLPSVGDPLERDIIQEEILELRNRVCSLVIQKLGDWIDALARGWDNHFTQEAAVSFIYEDLLEAADRYNPTVSPPCKFTSFFCFHSNNMMRNRVKWEGARKRDQSKNSSLDSYFENAEKESKTLKEFIVKDERLDEQLDKRMMLKKIYSKATSKQRMILKRLYLGYTQNEVAQRLGISGTNVNMQLRQLRAAAV
jgi:RNA polymerase sigma factor (sigma-70 family)